MKLYLNRKQTPGVVPLPSVALARSIQDLHWRGLRQVNFARPETPVYQHSQTGTERAIKAL